MSVLPAASTFTVFSGNSVGGPVTWPVQSAAPVESGRRRDDLIKAFVLLHLVAAAIALHLVELFVDRRRLFAMSSCRFSADLAGGGLHGFARDNVRFQQPHSKLDIAVSGWG